MRGRDGSQRKVELRDFLEEADKIPQETFARIRALYTGWGGDGRFRGDYADTDVARWEEFADY